MPGSHAKGLQPSQQRRDGYCNKELIPPDDFHFSQVVSVPARAGDVLLFSALLWHSSQGNRSDRLRSRLHRQLPGGDGAAGQQRSVEGPATRLINEIESDFGSHPPVFPEVLRDIPLHLLAVTAMPA